MTRRRDLMCEDIFGCDHKMTLPISENGEIIYWRCSCGAKKQNVTEPYSSPNIIPDAQPKKDETNGD